MITPRTLRSTLVQAGIAELEGMLNDVHQQGASAERSIKRIRQELSAILARRVKIEWKEIEPAFLSKRQGEHVQVWSAREQEAKKDIEIYNRALDRDAKDVAKAEVMASRWIDFARMNGVFIPLGSVSTSTLPDGEVRTRVLELERLLDIVEKSTKGKSEILVILGRLKGMGVELQWEDVRVAALAIGKVLVQIDADAKMSWYLYEKNFNHWVVNLEDRPEEIDPESAYLADQLYELGLCLDNCYGETRSELEAFRKWLRYWLPAADAMITVNTDNGAELPLFQGDMEEGQGEDEDRVSLPLSLPTQRNDEDQFMCTIPKEYLREDWASCQGPFFEEAASKLRLNIERFLAEAESAQAMPDRNAYPYNLLTSPVPLAPTVEFLVDQIARVTRFIYPDHKFGKNDEDQDSDFYLIPDPEHLFKIPDYSWFNFFLEHSLESVLTTDTIYQKLKEDYPPAVSRLKPKKEIQVKKKTKAKKARKANPTKEIRILPVDEEDGSELEEQGFDLYQVLDEADALFSDCGIRISSVEKVSLVAVVGSIVVGAASLGSSRGDLGLTFTFSVVVSDVWRLQGIARSLVRRLLQEASQQAQDLGEPAEYQVWVVNPHMADLLASLGFDEDARGWSLERPHMTRAV